MAPSTPPNGRTAVKRPWYLFAALVAGWLYGWRSMSEGYETVMWYRGERIDFTSIADTVTDSTAREAILAAAAHLADVMDAARARAMPLGIAAILLGGAMLLFAARSMAGREGSRSALVQVLGVHAAVVVTGLALTAPVARAQFEVWNRISDARIKVLLGITQPQPESQKMAEAFARVSPGVDAFMEIAFSGLIILALTRPRSRAFFEAATSRFGQG
jgi:hypothetical protein